MKTKVVLPGEKVAAGEEFLAGDGTYEDQGDIYASQMGELDLDLRGKVARVRGYNPPVELKVGDLVLATVEDIKPTMAILTVQTVEGIERAVTGRTEGTLHISKVSEAYTEDIREEFRSGDLVRARVLQVKPSIQLATNEDPLGVVRALCTRCRFPLVKKEQGLYCENEERYESRKVASTYDTPVNWGKS